MSNTTMHVVNVMDESSDDANVNVAQMNGVDSTGDGIAPYKSRLPTGGYAVSGAHMYSVQCGCINSHSEEKWETILGMAERNEKTRLDAVVCAAARR